MDPCCPVCNADLPLAGDEGAGDEVFCSYCGARFRLAKSSAGPERQLEEDD